MDWIALAGIGATAAVAITAQVVGALSKRGDRRHEIALEFDKRAWDGKRDALLALLRWAKGIRREAAVIQDPVVLAYRRSDILTFIARNPLEDSDAVTAYASQNVQDRYEQLQDLLDRTWTTPVKLTMMKLNLVREAKTLIASNDPPDEDVSATVREVRDLMKFGTNVVMETEAEAEVDEAASSLDPDLVLSTR